MTKKKKTIQRRLFINYAFIIIITFLMIFAVSIYAFNNNTDQMARKSQVNLCTSLTNNLESEIEKMNTISMNVVYSNLIKDNFKEYHSSLGGNNQYIRKQWDTMNIVLDVITAIIGPFQTVSQINIYNLEGISVGTGNLLPLTQVDLEDQDWYEPTLSANGNKFIGQPQVIDGTRVLNSYESDKTYIGLYRTYKDNVYNPEGIIEVLQDTNILFKFIGETLELNPTTKIFVFNETGQQLYPLAPYTDDQSGNYYYKHINNDNMIRLDNYLISDEFSKNEELMTFDRISRPDWTVFVVDQLRVLREPTDSYVLLLLFVMALILILTIAATYWISNKMANPLKVLANTFESMDLENILNQTSHEPDLSSSPVREIEILNTNFLSMRSMLKESSQRLLLAKSEETRAKMLALQSFMNPHFIYNILTHITIMSEEGMNEKIGQLSQDVSDLLRYISTEEIKGVELSTEMTNTEKYLRCMQLRFGEDLSFDIDIPEEMQTMYMPKLMVQPLVENSILHGFVNSPPWHVEIHGKICGTRWKITIEDDGIGFDPLFIKQFSADCGKLKENPTFDHLEIGGLGILSVFLRMLIFFGPDSEMSIVNTEKGSIITLSGTIPQSLDYQKIPMEGFNES